MTFTQVYFEILVPFLTEWDAEREDAERNRCPQCGALPDERCYSRRCYAYDYEEGYDG